MRLDPLFNTSAAVENMMKGPRAKLLALEMLGVK